MGEIVGVEVGLLKGHPGNANRMSAGNFRKLKRHIERTGRYEPLVVRPFKGGYQILNGHHRCKVLKELGYSRVDCVVWDVDDEQADVLLLTLNRLGARDVVEKKAEILKRVNERISFKDMSKLLPSSSKQIEALINFKLPEVVRGVKAENFRSLWCFL